MTSDGAVPKPSAYAAAGVDINVSQEAVRRIVPLAKSTYTPRVLSEIGGFGGLFKLEGYREPVLVASTDGVGTKLRIAIAMGVHNTIGADLVNHCINDIWVQGADPLFFLDYIAAGRLVPEQVEQVVAGMAAACRDSGCALIGGETAQMPGIYSVSDYDVAGFIVGAVERWDVIDGNGIRAGDVLVGLPSSGLHTNGYSLVRRAFELDDHPERLNVHHPDLGKTLGEALLAVHIPYYKPLKPVQKRIRGMAHITGGGIVDNVPRILPANTQAVIRRDAWEAPPLFRIIQRQGGVDEQEMYRVFNMGIGLIVVVRPGEAGEVVASMPGARMIGEMAERRPGDPPLVMV